MSVNIVKLSLRESHSLMDDRMQHFCDILVRLRGTDIFFYCFLIRNFTN